MPEDKDKKQPWEEAGFKTFTEYTEAQEKKVADAQKERDDLKAKLEEAEKKATEKPKVEEEKKEEKVVTDDQFKIKAATLYASLDEAQRENAELVISNLPEEIQAVAKDSFEAKYMILKDIYPDQAGADDDDGSIFGSLKKKAPKKNIADVVGEAMKALRGGTVRPERNGSGFVPGKKTTDSKTEQKPFDVMNGLYTG